MHTSATARATAFWLAVTATALTSCGGDDGPGGEAIAIDDFPAAYQAATCEVWVRCSFSPDIATCNATVSAGYLGEVATLVAAVKRGTIRYDGAATRACLDALDRGCGSASPPASCEQALQGQLAGGSTCVNSTECAAGTCDKQQCAGNTCCAGTCVPRVPAGGSCDGGARCSTGTFCLAGVCTENLPLGASCTASSGCASPGFCEIPAGATAGKCALWDAAGSSCDPARPYPCGRIDERCDPTTNRCVKVSGVGEPCAVTRDCALYAQCVQGVCTAAPTAGGACAADSERSCQGLLMCTAGTCVAPVAQPACVPAN